MNNLLRSQYQTRTRNINVYVEPEKEKNSDDEIDEEEKEEEEKKKEQIEQDKKSSVQFTELSHHTDINIEKEIAQKGYYNTVEEIVGRERFNMELKQAYKRFITCFDNE